MSYAIYNNYFECSNLKEKIGRVFRGHDWMVDSCTRVRGLVRGKIVFVLRVGIEDALHPH